MREGGREGGRERKEEGGRKVREGERSVSDIQMRYQTTDTCKCTANQSALIQ